MEAPYGRASQRFASHSPLRVQPVPGGAGLGAGVQGRYESDSGRPALEESIEEGERRSVCLLQVVDDQVNAPGAGQRSQNSNERVERTRAAHPFSGSALSREHGKLGRRERQVACQLGIGESLQEHSGEGVNRRIEHVVTDVLVRLVATDQNEPARVPRDIACPADDAGMPVALDHRHVECAIGHLLESRRQPVRDLGVGAQVVDGVGAQVEVGVGVVVVVGVGAEVVAGFILAIDRRRGRCIRPDQRAQRGSCVGPKVTVLVEQRLAKVRQIPGQLPPDSIPIRMDRRSGCAPSGHEAAEHHFGEDDAERIHVRRRRRRFASSLLGSQVGRRACSATIEARSLALVERDENSEIQQLEYPLDAEHEIAWLQIAMDDSVRVQELECRQDLCREVECEANSIRWRTRRNVVCQNDSQVLAVDELHREEGTAAVIPQVVKANEMRMSKRGDDAKLTFEPQDSGGRRSDQPLEGHVLLPADVVSEPDRAHRAMAQFADQTIPHGLVGKAVRRGLSGPGHPPTYSA